MVNETAPAGGSRADADASSADLPKPAAGLLSSGVALLALGAPLLAVAGYQSLRHDVQLWSSSFNAGTVLFVAAAILLVVGAVSLGLGVFRLVERADRRAGARRVPADPAELPPIPQ